MTKADDKQKRDNFVKNAEIVGAGVVGAVAGAVAVGAAAMAIDPGLKGKVEKKVEEGREAVSGKVDEVKEKVEEAKEEVAKKLK